MLNAKNGSNCKKISLCRYIYNLDINAERNNACNNKSKNQFFN